MKSVKRAMVVGVCAVVVAAGVSLGRQGQGADTKAADAKEAGAGGMPSKEEIARMQAEMMEQMNPTKEHEVLAKMAGEWTMRVSYSAEPGAPKVTVESKATAKMVLGGRFLKLESTGEMMGMPLETLTLMGFDRRFGKYTMVGFDTMGTYYIEAEGSFDEKTGVMVLEGTNYESAMKKDMKFRFTNTIVSDDERRQTLVFDIPGMGETTIMEAVYTRVK